jgi:hypothetical protein
MSILQENRRAPQVLLAAAALLGVAGLALWDWIAIVLVAPWLGAVVWVVARCGLEAVMPTEGEAFPSAAEAARRRLAAR